MATDIGKFSFDYFAQWLKPEVMQTLLDSLTDETKAMEIGKMRDELKWLIAQLEQFNAANYIKGGYEKSPREMYQSMVSHAGDLSAIRSKMAGTAKSEATMEKAIEKMYILLHKIMDFLTENQTATTQYIIYYSAPGQNNPNVIQKTITAADFEEAISNGSISLVKQMDGVLTDLDLTLSQVKKLKGTEAKNPIQADKENGTWERLSKEAIRVMYEQMRTMRAEKKRSKRYTRLRRLFGYRGNGAYLSFDEYWKNNSGQITITDKNGNAVLDKDGNEQKVDLLITKLMNYYTHMISLGKNETKPSYNRGHIAEAFTRLLGIDNPTDQQIADAFMQSLGNDVWWSTGDVGSTQVKSMVGSNTQVQVASLHSIFTLADNLLQLFDVWEQRYSLANQEKASNGVADLLMKKIQAKSGNKEVEEGLYKIIDQIVAEGFKERDKKWNNK